MVRFVNKSYHLEPTGTTSEMGVIKGVMISLLIKFISATNTSVIFVLFTDHHFERNGCNWAN